MIIFISLDHTISSSFFDKICVLFLPFLFEIMNSYWTIIKIKLPFYQISQYLMRTYKVLEAKQNTAPYKTLLFLNFIRTHKKLCTLNSCHYGIEALNSMLSCNAGALTDHDYQVLSCLTNHRIVNQMSEMIRLQSNALGKTR